MKRLMKCCLLTLLWLTSVCIADYENFETWDINNPGNEVVVDGTGFT